MIKLALLVVAILLLARGGQWLANRLRHHYPANSGSKGSPMTPREAADVLGLPSRYNKEDVVSAHRRLMQGVHPDRGGSNYLAQQLNEAKDLLLKQLDS